MNRNTANCDFKMRQFCWFTVVIVFIMFLRLKNTTAPVVIYTSAEGCRVEHIRQRLWEEFSDYEILIEYLPTGNHAARLLMEDMDSECDITYDLEYTQLEKLAQAEVLAKLDQYDYSVYCDDVVQGL